MKNLIRKITPKPFRDLIVHLAGLYVTDTEPQPPAFPSQEGAFRTLKSLGWDPSACIDIGAHNGEWAAMFRRIFAQSKVLMVEPLDEKRATLQEAVSNSGGGLSYAAALLGAADGAEVTFVQMGTGSSVYEESSAYPRHRSLQRLVRLDTLIAEHPQFSSPQALKLDTQGYELEVLKGCPHLLRSVEVLLLEVSLVPINQGAPLFSDIVAFVTANDFRLFDFCSQIRRKDGVLWQTDLLFIRNRLSVLIVPKLTQENWNYTGMPPERLLP
ncbi:MAG: FkbM family methyltransferase [Verrucomicrobia bacterium]|jgi:FkbM family methyltransferase|nr:FkbM family methyltransferase [Verrucomicrobiota bacterium]